MAPRSKQERMPPKGQTRETFTIESLTTEFQAWVKNKSISQWLGKFRSVTTALHAVRKGAVSLAQSTVL